MTLSNNLDSADRDEELVQLIAQGQRRLRAFVLSLLRRQSDADDVLQEVNVVLWRKRQTYRPGSNFFAWAFEIARLQVLAYRERKLRQGEPFDAALLAQIAEAAEIESPHYNRREAALRRCLQKLPQRKRELITLRYQPHVTVNSLAAELGKTAKAVSESLRRIRMILRECIERTLAAESRP
jgi:RNA polymerase sigma-70 factor, ECF subfamily